MKNFTEYVATKKVKLLTMLLAAVMLLGGCELPEEQTGGETSGGDAVATVVPTEEPRSPVDPSTLPAYSGDTYTEVNNNVPEFSEEELTVNAYEYYSELDELGRCGMAIASCGIELMPTGPRGDISSIYPSGWDQDFYDYVDGEALYNRSHLLGRQLTGEDANDKNLITGTRYMNAEGMEPLESLIADYIKDTGNHVAYRVTPIFVGDELVCRGVQMEAFSIEDGGEGICFNVYCYNLQPGVIINYETGENWEDKDIVLNTNSLKIHRRTCRAVHTITEKNRADYEGSLDALLKEGYTKCKLCFG